MIVMPYQGQKIVNKINGDSYKFLTTAKDSNGACVVMKAEIMGRGQFVPAHYHAIQEESFEVVDGQLTVIRNGKTSVLQPGEKITFSINEPHNHFNNHNAPLVYIHTVAPALDFDYLIENLIGLSSDGKGKNGRFGLMQELVSLKYLDSKSFLATIPQGIQKVLMNTVAPIGRLLGYRAIYKKYSDIEK